MQNEAPENPPQNLSIKDIVTKFLDEQDAEKKKQIYMQMVFYKGRYRQFHKEIIKQCNERDKKYFYYLITCTVRDENKEKENEIEEYITKQCKRKALNIIEAYIVKEYTKRGIVHFHLSVKATKFIARNRFQYYEKLYGSVQVNKTRVNTLEESLNYMSKPENKHAPKKII